MHKQVKKMSVRCLAVLLIAASIAGCSPKTENTSSNLNSAVSTNSNSDYTESAASGTVEGENSTMMNESTNNNITTASAAGNSSSKSSYSWSGEDDNGVMITDGFISSGVKPNTKKATLTKSTKQYNGEIIYYNLAPEIQNGKEDWDFGFFMLALQGLVNRDKPQVYFKTENHNLTTPTAKDYQGWISNMDTDLYWLTYLTTSGQYLSNAKIKQYSGEGRAVAAELLTKFKSYFKGLVVWDPNVAATSNVAATIAGVDSLLPVRYDTSSNSIYTWLTKTIGLPVKVDLCNKFTGKSGSTIYATNLKSTGSAKNDAYLYAKVNYLDANKTSTRWMGHFADAYPQSLSTNGVESYSGTHSKSLDFLISQKAFIFDLCQYPNLKPLDDPNQALGTDYDTFNKILESQYKRSKGSFYNVMGWTTWKNGNFDKYDETQQEFDFWELFSQYHGVGECDSVASNTSVFQHVSELASYKQTGNTKVDMSKYDPNMTYFMFYLGDFDSTAWLERYMPRLWEQSARGDLPIAWNINGSMSDSCKVFFNYMYDTATPNDYFVAGNNGAGYLNVEYLEKDKKDPKYAGKIIPDGVDTWKAYNKTIYSKYDLSINPFLIITNGNKWSDRVFKSLADVAPNGLGYWNHNVGAPIKTITNSNGVSVPLVRQEYGVTNLNSEQEIYDYFLDHLTNSKYSSSNGMFNFKVTIVSPAILSSVINRLKKDHPEKKFEVVDPYTFFAYAAKRAQ